MFLRKLLGSNEAKQEQRSGPPAGMQTMGANLQKRFSKGIQYNMKIIIKGDRNVGKTCLFQRLQGQKFREEYLPTEEIQVASIMWNYKATDDIVKVEVWDVVDKGKKKKKIEGLKLDTAADGLYEDPCLDAEFVDVYKGTQGVILIMDITKQWTYDYVERELPGVPPNLPVLVLGNHRDMGHHRTVTEDQVSAMIEQHQRPAGSAHIRYAESSMRNGFGLKYIHKFFNLPFLQLQRETLLKQLETNSVEIKTTNEELDFHEESEDQNYDVFLDSLTNKRRREQDKLSEKAITEAKTTQEDVAEAVKQSKDLNTSKSAPVTPVVPISGAIREAPPAKPIPGLDLNVVSKQSSTTSSVSPTSKSVPHTPVTEQDSEPKASFMSRLFGGKKPKAKETQDVDTLPSPSSPSKTIPTVRSVDDFAPDEALDASFLDDANDVKLDKGNNHLDQDSSSEDERNPMVVSDQDDVDIEDTSSNNLALSKHISVFSADLELSSDEETRTHTLPVVTGDVDFSSDSDEITTAKKTRTKSKSGVPVVNGKSSLFDVNNIGNISSNLILSEKNKDTVSSKMQTQSSDSTQDNSSRETSVEKSFLKPTLKSLSQNFNENMVTSPASPLLRTDVDENSDVEEDQTNSPVVVMDDVEDISDEDITASSNPGNSTPATDATVENDDSLASDTKPNLGLEFEDLSVLEKGFNFNTGLPRDDSLGDDLQIVRHEEPDTTSKKKKVPTATLR